MSWLPDPAGDVLRVDPAGVPTQIPEHLRAASAQISADIQAFMAAGGRIEKLEHGAAGKPVLKNFQQVNRENWTHRQERAA